MSRPTKPSVNIPNAFAINGIKTEFENTKLSNGFSNLNPDILAGDNLNKFIDDNMKVDNYALLLGDYVDEIKVQIGSIIWYAKSTALDGYLVCNGGAVSRTIYSNLYSVIGTTFGIGDGSTTFNLPNLVDKFAEGGTSVGTYINAGLPSAAHTHWWGATTSESGNHQHGYTAPSGGLTSVGGAGFTAVTGAVTEWAGTHTHWVEGTTSSSNPGGVYGASSTVQPPALVLLPCIKY